MNDYKESYIFSYDDPYAPNKLNEMITDVKNKTGIFGLTNFRWKMSRNFFDELIKKGIDHCIHYMPDGHLATRKCELLGIEVNFDKDLDVHDYQFPMYTKVILEVRGKKENYELFYTNASFLNSLYAPPSKPIVKEIIFNDPATIVYWKDGSKTVVKCQKGDTFDKEKGFLMAYFKKCNGNKGNFNDKLRKLVNSDV